VGNNPLEERDPSGTVKNQYMWSGAGAPRLGSAMPTPTAAPPAEERD